MVGFDKRMRPKPDKTKRETGDGQTAPLLFRLPQSSQRLDLGALSILLHAVCWILDSTSEQEMIVHRRVVLSVGCQNWGFKTESAKPKIPCISEAAHRFVWVNDEKGCKGSWQMKCNEMPPTCRRKGDDAHAYQVSILPLSLNNCRCIPISSSPDLSVFKSSLTLVLKNTQHTDSLRPTQPLPPHGRREVAIPWCSVCRWWSTTNYPWTLHCSWNLLMILA